MQHIESENIANAIPEQETVSVFDTDSIDSIIDSINRPNIANEVPETTTGTAQEEQQQEDNSVETYIDSIESAIDSTSNGPSENESRFSGAAWFEYVKQFNVTIAGVGGIGSWTSMMIARLHPNYISLYDDDCVEYANMAGQLFSYQDIGSPKVASAGNIAREYCEYYSIFTYQERFVKQTFSNVMICGFDNMASRRAFFDNWGNQISKMHSAEERRKYIYIDGRLGMEELQIFAIRGDENENMKKYLEEYLFDDSEAENVPCSMKQTTFMSAMIGSMITNILVNFATNLNEGIDIRPIPFLTLYNADSMRLQIKY